MFQTTLKTETTPLTVCHRPARRTAEEIRSFNQSWADYSLLGIQLNRGYSRSDGFNYSSQGFIQSWGTVSGTD